MDLRWWLQGDKCNCSNHANCSRVVKTPAGPGYRCVCKDGFLGDGYPAGAGCRKASCHLANYLSGQCGGAARIAVLIGGIAAVVAFMVTLGLLCCFIRRRSTAKAKGFTKLHLAEATGINIPIYPYREIEKATNSFSETQRLGTGAYGTVYAGKLHNGLGVAIKRIKHRDGDSIDRVMNEIKLISSVNHPNLVRLLALKVVDFSRPQNEVNLAALAIDRIGKGRLDEIIDPFLDIHSDAWTLSSVHQVAELAFICLAFDRDMRPSMMEVVAELEQIRLSRWPSIEINCTFSSNETSCSSSSNISEKPLSFTDKNTHVENSRGLFTETSSVKSMEMAKDNSPVSAQDPWLSEQSSPSSSSRINTVIQ
ncbi:hypothetical protein GH714_005696 [Hevea brasiliensis]|uniref:Protein kinase domain-containing protein n=1 Tax=Hevea brasiliensis TaxID=3981 RepID=A0A6A6M880_HEVBR|nr:hypothetical protein GH714_005696 [Hevea brasiliensis]